MRFNPSASAPAYLTALLFLSQTLNAFYIPPLLHELGEAIGLEKRQQCANPCGYYKQLCCQSNEQCYTDSAGQAQCGPINVAAATLAGQVTVVPYLTTTYLQTDYRTVTTTLYTTYQAACSNGGTQCGSQCCLNNQYCDRSSNQCINLAGSSGGIYSNIYTVTTYITSTANVPAVRPTTNSFATVTVTGSASSTVPYQTPSYTNGYVYSGSSTSSSSSGLSGGAIAGIVIGVIAGVILLLLFCLCCCFKGLIDGVLALFGLGKSKTEKRTTEEVYIDDRRSRRRTGFMGGWFGQRASRVDGAEGSQRRKSKISPGAAAAGFLGGLALLLGLKRKHDGDNKSSSGYGSSYYYSDTSTSSSSDRRTRRSSRSRSRAG